ncbi:C40 family peptidase [Streptomyces sp. HPF1205]|uniref:C40 family peptidase n=1 Tax=Streptomyces sp. HPF1205 TaxID=2873262 RepID=UPI001CED4A92|nr:C40 family peptidase [Streptomyces sp. HPF1205]
MTALHRTAPQGVSARLSRIGAASVLTAAAVAVPPVFPGTAQRADAATLALQALGVAASKQGSPYQWGATGPYRFDCSGLTMYSFKHVGKKLPRTAAAQYNSTRHIGAGSRHLGDLVFFHSGSYVYHVGIYAGNGRIWHAPKTGARVRLEKIWTRSVWYGRVR